MVGARFVLHTSGGMEHQVGSERAERGPGARSPSSEPPRASRVLLPALGVAVAVWLCGVGIVAQQRLTGGPTYTYWLETTLSAALVSPVALLLAARRPGHRLTWLYSAFVVVGAGQLFTGASATALQAGGHAAAIVFALLHDAIQMSFVLLLVSLALLYPTGRLPGSRWRPVGWCIAVGGGLAVLSVVLAPEPGNFPGLSNPVGTSMAAVGVLGTGEAVLLGLGIAGAVAAPVVRYRRSRGLERLQLKWFTFAVIVGIVFLVGVGSQLPDDSAFGAVLWTLVPSGVLASIGVAVFRYRLLEIDRIISRTVSYAVVSALLVGLYALAVVVLTPALAGIGGGSRIAVAAATLLVAAAFGPVRRRVQSAIDRRFDRGRYDAARTVEAFAGGLRDEVDIQQLTDRLVGVVGDTVAPSRVTVWLANDRTST